MQTIRSSFGYYRDMTALRLQPGQHIEVPAAFARFPRDIPGVDPPRELAERHLRIAHWTVMPRGGHFARFGETCVIPIFGSNEKQLNSVGTIIHSVPIYPDSSMIDPDTRPPPNWMNRMNRTL